MPSGSGSSPLRGSRVVSPDEPTRVSGVPLVGETPLAIDNLIEGYRVENEVHRGGQGVVYRAVQLATKRTVALKVLLEGPFAGETARRRFEREVELAASLQHPNIVTILHSGESAGRYFCAMEFVDGLRLDRYLAQVRPNFEETINLFVRVCDAVNYAHQRGVIHRDLKPSNILVDPDGQPRVLDFGLAKASRQAEPEQATVEMLSSAGQLVGTIAYMSPEQARSEQDIDVRSDVYSLGVVLYESLLGQPPYPITGPLGDVLHAIVHADPVAPRAIRSRTRFQREVDDEVETILLKALDKDRSRRYQSAGELARDLRHLLAGEPIEAKRASTLYLIRKLLKRYKLQAAGAALFLLIMLGFLISFAVLYTRESQARTRANDLLRDRDRQAREALIAERRQREARTAAEASAKQALAAKNELQRALAQQRIARGNSALARSELLDARESFWQAFLEQGGAAARWALRQYYLASGDDAATVLFASRDGPLFIDSQRGLAAVCETRAAITVRELESGRTVTWLPTPGPVTALRLSARGEILAAGADWIRVWSLDSAVPAIALSLPLGAAPMDLFVFPQLRRVALIRGRTLECYDIETGDPRATLDVGAELTGTPDIEPSRDLLALTTDLGLSFIKLKPDDEIEKRTVWNAVNSSPRAVRFLGAKRIVFIGDSVYSGELTDTDAVTWNTLQGTSTPWDFIDLASGGERVVVGRKSGEVASYLKGSLRSEWRTSSGGLAAVWFARDKTTVFTLNDSGVVTSWVQPSDRSPQRILRAQPLAAWAVNIPGTAAIYADERGNTFYYEPDSKSRIVPLSRRAFSFPGTESADVRLALSEDGRRAIIKSGSAVRLVSIPSDDTPPTDRAVINSLDGKTHGVAIDATGSMIATHVADNRGDQRIEVRAWPGESAKTVVAKIEDLPLIGRRWAFIGSQIRQIAFMPQSRQILVARSNGDLTLVDPRDPTLDGNPANPADAAAPRPWITLDSAARSFAFDREGTRIAAACDDGDVRVILNETGEILARFPVGADCTSIAFDRDGIFIRRADGSFSVYEIATGEAIAQIPLEPGRGLPGAFSVGAEDRVVVGEGGRISEFAYGKFDMLIKRNRPYAIARAARRARIAGDLTGAWDLTVELASINELSATEERISIIEQVLHRPGAVLNSAWFDAVEPQLSSAHLLRLGHAAYAGEKFELAERLLSQSADTQGGHADAITAQRIAEAHYLDERYADAAVEFRALAGRPDVAPLARPTINLVNVAALVFSGEHAEARTLAGTLAATDPQYPPTLAARSTAGLAGFLIGVNSESALISAIDQLLQLFEEESLLYRDDANFFRGELARARGDTLAAAAEYQRCIDVARDDWPSNWARCRLLQMSQRIGTP